MRRDFSIHRDFEDLKSGLGVLKPDLLLFSTFFFLLQDKKLCQQCFAKRPFFYGAFWDHGNFMGVKLCRNGYRNVFIFLSEFQTIIRNPSEVYIWADWIVKLGNEYARSYISLLDPMIQRFSLIFRWRLRPDVAF